MVVWSLMWAPLRILNLFIYQRKGILFCRIKESESERWGVTYNMSCQQKKHKETEPHENCLPWPLQENEKKKKKQIKDWIQNKSVINNNTKFISYFTCNN